MPQVNKIGKYDVAQRVLELSVGRNTYQVSEAICAELQARGINDTISQSAVSRFLKAAREARAEATRTKVQEHIQEHVPADLGAIEEIELWLLERFRGRVDLTEDISRIGRIGPIGEVTEEEEKEKIKNLAQEIAVVIDGDHKTRAEFGMKAAKLIELKLKYAGILENTENKPSAGVDPEDLEQFRSDMEAARGQVRTH